MNWFLAVLLFLIIGFILLLIEIFLLPGFGPVGLGSLLFLGLGAYLAWAKLSTLLALAVTVISTLAVIGSLIYLTKSGVAQKFVLGQAIGKDPKKHNQPESTQKLNGVPVVGQIGVALCSLRPAGIGEFNHQRINILTDGVYIEKDTQIRIIRIEGNRIFVEEVKSS